MLNISLVHADQVVLPMESLEIYFRDGGTTIIRAAFAHSYFIHPDAVRARTPYYPDRARVSREHYPGLGRAAVAVCPAAGRQVVLDHNQRAQMAWQRYTGFLARGSGYGLRHICGHPWHPDSFTAGWNFCYMPYWAGMLTEDQHPHPDLQDAIRQASWELYFRDNPVCQPPDFVQNPGLDLHAILGGQPILVMVPGATAGVAHPETSASNPTISGSELFAVVQAIRSEMHQSWVNIRKALMSLQGKEHQPFGTANVETSAKACLRRILRETGLTPEGLELLLDQNGICH